MRGGRQSKVYRNIRKASRKIGRQRIMQGGEGKVWKCKFYICSGIHDNRSHLIRYQTVLDGSFLFLAVLISEIFLIPAIFPIKIGTVGRNRMKD